MKIDGGCHCGYITYEGEAEVERAVICHCTDCQRLSGSAFRSAVPVKGDTFRILSGEPTVYLKTAESGNQRRQAFCPRCGTSIYSSAPVEKPPSYMVRTGTARQRDQIVPKSQIWTRSRQHWLADLPAIHGVAKE